MFSGDMVDMRGHSHGPGNPWILAILLAAMGDVREAPFHLAYTLFSIVAALAMWSLARRFCERPFAATLLFIAVPAFVVNGNSFEADLPFLAFWMASVALFVKAVDEDSIAALAGSAIAGAFAGLTAYQAVLLTPVLAVYLFQRRCEMVSGMDRDACRSGRDRRVAALGMEDARRASGSGADGLYAQLLVQQDVEHAAQRRRAGGAFGLDRISAAGDRGILAQAKKDGVCSSGGQRCSQRRSTI